MKSIAPLRSSLPALFVALASLASRAQVPEFTVGSGGTHSSIQAAVNACPVAGCVISLTESDYDLPREIWIESKDNLVLRAAPALELAGTKPRLHTSANLLNLAGTGADSTDSLRPAGWRRWPTKSTSVTSVGAAGNTTNRYSTTGFQYNGLIVVDSSRNVRIDGLLIDGQSPTYFVNKGIWNNLYDVLFGNVGVNLMHSKGVVVRDCEIRNFFAALYINDRNLGGLFAEPHTDGIPSLDHPGSNPGIMGDHLIERNVFHHNWWVAYDETEWDLGSTFRFNRCLDNRNANFAKVVDSSSDEGKNMAGGFLYVKDVPHPIHRIHNNTIWGSPMVIGYGYTSAGPQHLFYNNIVGGFDRVGSGLSAMPSDARQMLIHYTYWLENNLFEVGAADSLYQIQTFPIDRISDSSACAGEFQNAPCYVTWDSAVKVTVGVRNQWLWNGWTLKQGGTYLGTFKGVQYPSANNQQIELFPGGGLVERVTGFKNTYLDVSSKKNRWVKSLPFKSLVAGSVDLLVPDGNSDLVKASVKAQGREFSGVTESVGTLDLGAAPSSDVPTLFGFRSQLTPLASGGNCWTLPLLDTSSQILDGRIQTVQAWSVPASPVDYPERTDPSKLLDVLALADSSLGKPSVKICLDVAPPASIDIRFQLEASGHLKDGTLFASEPAYFIVPPPYAPVGATPRLAARSSIRFQRRSGHIVAQGLAEGIAQMTLRALDGRVLREVRSLTRAGTLSIDASGIPRGPVVVQVRQGDNSWQSLNSLF